MVGIGDDPKANASRTGWAGEICAYCPLFFRYRKIDDPAPPRMRPVIPAVGGQVRDVAPGVLNCAFEPRPAVEGLFVSEPASEGKGIGREQE